MGSPAGSVPSILTWGVSFGPNQTGPLSAAAPEEGPPEAGPPGRAGPTPRLWGCWLKPGAGAGQADHSTPHLAAPSRRVAGQDWLCDPHLSPWDLMVAGSGTH